MEGGGGTGEEGTRRTAKKFGPSSSLFPLLSFFTPANAPSLPSSLLARRSSPSPGTPPSPSCTPSSPSSGPLTSRP